MPFPLLAPLIMAAGSAIGGALSNRSKTVTSTPKYDAEFSPLKNALIAQIMSRLNQPSALPQGYEEGNIRNINRTYALAGQNLSNRLTARGMATSPVAANAATQMALGRAGQIATMQSELPMVERTFRNQDLAMGQGILGMGKGGATTDPGNPWGGAFQSGADMLAYLYGKGAFSTSSPSGPSAAPITIGALPTAPMIGVGNPLLKKPGFTGWRNP